MTGARTEYQRRYYLKRRDTYLAKKKAEWPDIKATQVAQKRLKNTGWTPERYQIFQYAQGGLCYLCGETNYAKGRNYNLSADHDHDLELPRGLLCHDCNMQLGIFELLNKRLDVKSYLHL